MKTLIPKVSEGIFDVIAEFNKTDDYVLYYHSGRKTIRAFRRKDGKQIANYRLVIEKVLCFLRLLKASQTKVHSMQHLIKL